MTDTWVIETDALTKRYGEVEAVRQLTLRVNGNRITGFLGRNGAGKSSTIRMLLGISPPTAGTGTLLGRRIDDSHASRDTRRHVAYVAEDKQTYGYLTVSQMIAFTRSFYSDWMPDLERRLLRQYDLPLHRKVKALSKGMRTKLALLLALSRRPQLLILDEPSEGLDPVSVEELLQSLVAAAADGTTVFFSSHQIAEVERIADHICIIDRGQLVVDTPLDRIRQEYRRLVLGFPESPPRLDFDGADIGSVHVSGRQITLMARANADAIVKHAYRLGAIAVEAAPVSLREVFLESVTERAQ